MTHSLFRRAACAAATIALCASGASASADGHVLRIGTEGAYPPFNFVTAGGELTGFDVEIAEALCAEMKMKCEFVTQDWDGIIPALLAGKFDAIIASMSITEERKKKVDFTEKYYNTPPAIAAPKNTSLKGVRPADLSGMVIGAQGSTTHSNYAEAKFGGAEVRLYPTPDEYKLDLENGRLDAVIDDIVVLSEWIEGGGGGCCKVVGALPVDPVINGEGAGIALRKGEDDLRRKFNAAIRAIRANGKYAEINNKYFDFDVY